MNGVNLTPEEPAGVERMRDCTPISDKYANISNGIQKLHHSFRASLVGFQNTLVTDRSEKSNVAVSIGKAYMGSIAIAMVITRTTDPVEAIHIVTANLS